MKLHDCRADEASWHDDKEGVQTLIPCIAEFTSALHNQKIMHSRVRNYISAEATTWMEKQQLKQLWQRLVKTAAALEPSSVSQFCHVVVRWCFLPATCRRCMMSCIRRELFV